MKISISDIDLCGGIELGEEPFDFHVEVRPKVQIFQFFGAENAQPIRRDNSLTTVRFSVSRDHSSSCDATRFLFSHPVQILKKSGDVFFSADYPEEATYILRDGLISSMKSEQNGSQTTHHYEVLGGRFESIEN